MYASLVCIEHRSPNRSYGTVAKIPILFYAIHQRIFVQSFAAHLASVFVKMLNVGKVVGENDHVKVVPEAIAWVATGKVSKSTVKVDHPSKKSKWS